MRLVQERTALKILLGGEGAIISITMKKRAYFFFLTGTYVGAKIGPTADPDLGIVELCGYRIHDILRNWERLHLVVVRRNALPRV